MRIVNRRCAPAGGRGNGAALRIIPTAARSNAAEPELRDTETLASPPPDETEKEITAVPLARMRGFPTREIRRISIQ